MFFLQQKGEIGGTGEGRGQREDYGIEKITKSKPMRFTTILVTLTFLL